MPTLFALALTFLWFHWKAIAALAAFGLFGTMAQGKLTGFQQQGLWATQLGLALNRGTFLKAWQNGSVTYTASACSATTISEQSVTVTGVTVNDVFAVALQGAPTANVGAMGTSRCTAANTVGLRFINPTSGSLTPPASGVYLFCSIQVQ